MEKTYVDFFRKLLDNSGNLNSYVDSLYSNGNYSEEDLNHIFGVLKKNGLISCYYADDRAWVQTITFSGKHFFDDETQPRLIVLIDRINDIENLFHSSGFGDGTKSVIYDIQEFQDWIQEVNLELRDIYDRTKDHYIWETLNIFNEKLNGRNDKRIFLELRGRLNAIRKNIKKYYSENATALSLREPKEVKLVSKKRNKIFISHSSKDIGYVSLLVNLLDGMGLNQTQVFCSSMPGYDIPIDCNIFEYLRNQFSDYDLHVIFIHSNNYYKSPICLNEMGAAWALKNSVTSILLPGFDFEQMVGVVNDHKIAIKIAGNDIELKDKLNQLYDKIVNEFELTRKADIIWQQKRDAFISDARKIKVEANVNSPLSVRAIINGSFEQDTQVQPFNLDNIGSASELKKQIEELFSAIPKFVVGKRNEKNFSPFMSSVEIDNRIKETIRTYADAFGIVIAPDFFELGNLLKDSFSSNLLTGNKYSGSTAEIQKNAAIIKLYNLILNLISYCEIDRLYSPLSGIQLVLCNDGTTYAEDIDVQLKVQKSAVLLSSELPVPNTQLNLEGEYDFEDIFEIKATKDYVSYVDSKKNVAIRPVNSFYSQIDYESEYRETIERVFEYKTFDDGDCTILNCKFDYIKQHQKVAFPTWIFLKSIDTDIKISYTITSKSLENKLNGQIFVQKNHEEPLPDSHLS